MNFYLNSCEHLTRMAGVMSDHPAGISSSCQCGLNWLGRSRTLLKGVKTMAHQPGLGWALAEPPHARLELGGQLCSRALIYTAGSFCAPEPLGVSPG